MRKVTIRFAVTLLSCWTGLIAASPMIIKQSLHSEEAQGPQDTPVSALVKPRPPKDWKKIKVGRVSFCLPPHLRNTGLPGNAGVVEAFEGEVSGYGHLYLYYAYGENVPSDGNPSHGQSSEVIIGSRRAKINVWRYDQSELLSDPKLRPGMELFVPDVGDGKNKFEIYAVSFNSDVIEQIFSSVEIR